MNHSHEIMCRTRLPESQICQKFSSTSVFIPISCWDSGGRVISISQNCRFLQNCHLRQMEIDKATEGKKFFDIIIVFVKSHFGSI